MFKCCKKDDVGPSPLRLSSYREEARLSDVSNMSRRRLAEVSNPSGSRRSGLYDMSNIQLPPLPPRSASCREEGGASSTRFDVGNQPPLVLKNSRSSHWDELGSAFRRKLDVGSRRKSDVGSTSGIRSNLGKEPTALRDRSQTPPPHRVDDAQGYARQCHMCAETALYHFNKSAAWHWGCEYELVDAGISVAFMHRIEGTVYHSNFHARTRNSSPETPTMLFFAELWALYPNPAQVNTCCILGPTGAVSTGHNGCRACSAPPNWPTLHHPHDQPFDVGEEQCFLSQDAGAPYDEDDDDDYDEDDNDDDY